MILILRLHSFMRFVFLVTLVHHSWKVIEKTFFTTSGGKMDVGML
jgi:hypothetical protein